MKLSKEQLEIWKNLTIRFANSGKEFSDLTITERIDVVRLELDELKAAVAYGIEAEIRLESTDVGVSALNLISSLGIPLTELVEKSEIDKERII